MKAQIPFVVSISGNGVESIFPIEVVCVYGPPTAEPNSARQIPVTIKEVVRNGQPLDWALREFIIDAIGGVPAISEIVGANSESR